MSSATNQFSQSCRVCLKHESQMDSMFQLLYDGLPISQVFNALLPTIPTVLENDGFSNLICELCREKVIEFWNFRMLCLNSDVKMRLANKNPDQDATNIEQTPFTIVEIKQEATQMFEVEDEIVTHKSERRKRKRIVNFRESSFDSEEIGSNDSDFRPGKGDSNHKFSCKVCGKGFSTNYKLNRHSSVHTKKNPQTNSIRPVEKIEVIENHVEITNESLLGSKKSKVSPKNVCETCKKVFPSASKLRRHAVVHMSDQEKREELKKLEMVKKYECTICATRWNFPSELIRHYKQSHHLEDDEIEKPVPKPENSTAEDTNIGKKPYLKCNKCTKQFFTDLQLRRHQYMHSELVENSKIDYQNTDHEFVCVICLHKELIYSELINHMRNAHRDEFRDKEITCKLCYKTCNSMKNIVRHAKMHEENATHKCIVCSKLFGFGEDLLAHVMRHEKTKLYLCDYCPKTFFRKNNLRTHVQKHAKYPVSPAHLCSLCGKAFNESDLLKAHVKRHAGIKPWKCNLCPKSFSCQSLLKYHIQRHQGIKNHKCQICFLSFTKQEDLTKHSRTHSGEKRHECTVCHRKFGRSSNLTTHMRVHTGERPYQCKFERCERAYAQSGDLAKHLKVHLGEKIYRCDEPNCSEAFKFSKELKDHQSTHYQESLKTNQ